jgi:hypothetical protein
MPDTPQKVYIVAIVDYDLYLIKSTHFTREGAIRGWEKVRSQRIEEERDTIEYRKSIGEPHADCITQINLLMQLDPFAERCPSTINDRVYDRPIIEIYTLDD